MEALHPALWWGMAAAALPVVLHLLLRQRPVPVPWAAMRWLRAAQAEASRAWTLTNWLLLLLRLLILLVLAAALARPLAGAFGPGGTVVVILDLSASMAPRGPEPGPLATALANLDGLPYARVVVVTAGATLDIVADGGPGAATGLGARLAATALPGGLDSVAPGAGVLDGVLTAGRPDLLLVSDFQQDRGEALVAALGRERLGRVFRWAPASASGNGALLDVVEVPDPVVGSGSLAGLRLTGAVADLAVGLDGGPLLATPVSGLEGQGPRTVSVPVPALAEGRHLLRVRLRDAGVAADNLMELPVTVRGPVPALLVGARREDTLAAAWGSDGTLVTRRLLSPEALAGEALALGQIIAVRSATTQGTRLAAWVRQGGVLWCDYPVLAADPALAELANLRVGPLRAGGPFACGDADLDPLLALGGLGQVPEVQLPPGTSTVLSAGGEPVVVVIPVGAGRLVVELVPLAQEPSFQARGGTPLWALRLARRLTATAPVRWTAGAPAPADAQLERAGVAVTVTAGAPLRAGPGLWNRPGSDPVMILPSPEEVRLDRDPGAPSVREEAMPEVGNTDLGLPLLLLAAVLLLIEGAVAAWAGRTYGR